MRIIGNHAERVLIIGKTDSGKSVLAVKILLDTLAENRGINVLIINHKDESYLNEILPPLKRLPKHFKNGDRINIVPLLGNKDDENALDNLLKDIYHLPGSKGYKGTLVFLDEGLMLKASNPYMLALQTQGRAKSIGVITISQRPKWISLFTVTQATRIYVFNVQGMDDIKTLEQVMRLKDFKLSDSIDKLSDYEYLEYTGKDALIKEPCEYPVSGKVNPLKKPLPKKGIIFGALALTGILFKTFY